MAGTITTLGLGSGLDLQNILDQLKEADKSSITTKENELKGLQVKVDAYNSLNAKLFSMKSNALSLSLESNFQKTIGTISDEDVLSAIVDDGISEASYSVEVTQKAQNHSLQTIGLESEDTVLNPAPVTTITSTDENVTTADETMTIQYGALGEQQDINVSLTADMSLTQIAEAINTAAGNKDEAGNQLVSASINHNLGDPLDADDDTYYIRVHATDGGDSAESQVSVSGFDYVATDTTISFGLSDGTDPFFVSLAPGTTVSEAASRINSVESNTGVTASVINDGSAENPYRLVITSDNTGEENRIQWGETLVLTPVTGVDSSLNAIFSVNGITYNRQSNTGINDVIPGVSFTLKKAGETSLGVSKNTTSIVDDVKALVEGFNEIVKEINGTETTTETDDETSDTTDDENPLSDEYSVKSIISRLTSLLSTTVQTGGAYTSLFDLGLSTNKDGTITIDEDTLEQAVASDPDAVQSLFIGDEDQEITGLGDLLNDGLTTMVSSTGTVTSEIDEAEQRISRLEEDIETATEQLDKKYEIMTARFAELDKYINQLNAEASFMTSIFESFTKGQESS